VATKRKRKASWEYVVRRKDVLQRPLYLTFSTEAEGDQYVKRLEALLDAGIVPEEFRRRQGELTTIEDAARAYLAVQHVPVSDTRCLAIVVERVRGTRLSAINYEWVESWVVAMKRERNLSPSTIRHHVGALARCIDWCVRRGDVGVVINPLRLLPKHYAAYTESDAAVARSAQGDIRIDVERDRRLQGDDEARIRAILDGLKPWLEARRP